MTRRPVLRGQRGGNRPASKRGLNRHVRAFEYRGIHKRCQEYASFKVHVRLQGIAQGPLIIWRGPFLFRAPQNGSELSHLGGMHNGQHFVGGLEHRVAARHNKLSLAEHGDDHTLGRQVEVF